MRSNGGGIFLFVAMLAGGVLGVRAGQPTAGILIGVVVGLAVALGVALWDERRKARRG